MEQQVFPTKGNLMLSKKALQLATLGYDLLDRKRNILIRELMKLVDKAQMLRASIEGTYSDAYKALQQANISLGVVTPFAQCVPVENGITISSQSVMGVELPTVTLEKQPPQVHYGFARTTATLDMAYIAFEKGKGNDRCACRGRKRHLQTFRGDKKDTAPRKCPAKHHYPEEPKHREIHHRLA
jgi:V/A-type H+-transporting ATPase subunit D